MGRSMSGGGGGAHCLVLPYPIHSHITPLFNFSLTLASHGLSVTFVLPHCTFSRILQARPKDPIHADSLSLPAGLQMVSLPDGLPPEFDQTAHPEEFHIAFTKMVTATEELVEKLKADARPLTCIVADPFVSWSQPMAVKFNVPWVIFWTQSAAVFSIYHHFLTLGNRIPRVADVAQEDEADLISYVPGIPPLKPQHLPTFLFVNDEKETMYKFFCKFFGNLDAGDCILVNSFYEAESEIVDALKTRYPIYLVGPALPSDILRRERCNLTGTGVSLWKEEGCCQWLDTHQKQSLLYISFGSLVDMSSAQFHEIALALASTGLHFLWVIRKPKNADKTVTELLPEGFLELTKDQGRILSWAPQLEVLSHPAVGAFLSHGGWNSTLE
eukprot:c23291_g3_i1 orf=2-1153(-)